jgi:hypothetical protein
VDWPDDGLGDASWSGPVTPPVLIGWWLVQTLCSACLVVWRAIKVETRHPMPTQYKYARLSTPLPLLFLPFIFLSPFRTRTHSSSLGSSIIAFTFTFTQHSTMKFRSPSPVVGGALPTPPHSPTQGVIVPKATVAASVLDNLYSFYQQEQYWVHHTRASLELALAKGIDGDAILCPPEESVSAPSPASSTSTLCDSPLQNAVHVKPDPDAENTHLLLISPSGEQTHNSRWLRRKNRMRLRIDGINSHPHRNTGSKAKKSRPHKAPPSEPGARLLEMFSELVDARMESCQRISRMVQDSAARPQLQLMC